VRHSPKQRLIPIHVHMPTRCWSSLTACPLVRHQTRRAARRSEADRHQGRKADDDDQ
jgi:hypothetical protein